MKYEFKEIEKKWQDEWESNGVFHAKNDYSLPKYYALVEFPYPSGQGLQCIVVYVTLTKSELS